MADDDPDTQANLELAVTSAVWVMPMPPGHTTHIALWSRKLCGTNHSTRALQDGAARLLDGGEPA